MKHDVLENVKIHFNIDDNIQDEVLSIIIQNVIANFEFLYDNVPSRTHQFIIENITIKRFNRRKAEGLKQLSVEGHTSTYQDEMDDFRPYDVKIRKDFQSIKQISGVQFL